MSWVLAILNLMIVTAALGYSSVSGGAPGFEQAAFLLFLALLVFPAFAAAPSANLHAVRDVRAVNHFAGENRWTSSRT